MTPSRQAAPLVPSRWQAALIGAVAALSALGAGELVAAAAGTPVSPVTAIANHFIDSFAASLKSIAVALFGTHDKLALVIGIVVVSVVIAALLGLASRRWPLVGPIGIAGFGVLGGWVMSTDPQGGTGTAVVASLAAIAVGVTTFVGLWSLSTEQAHDRSAFTGIDIDHDHASGVEQHDRPFEPMPKDAARRRLLAASGGLLLASGAGTLLARRIRASDSVAAARSELVVPDADRKVRLPDTRRADVSGASTYITPNDEFYRIDTAVVTPQVSTGAWKLEIDGLVERPLRVSYDDLLALDSIAVPVTISCVSNEVGGELVGTAIWQGVPLADLLDRAGIDPSGEQVVGRSVDGFTAGFPLDLALDGRDALVAYAMNGEPLPVEHGYPARLIVPGLYGYVSATKWLERIEITTWDDFDGYWITRGWAKRGPIKTASRIDIPHGEIDAGHHTVAGVAWAPHRGITRVELQIDDGDWTPCNIGQAASDDTWVQWWLDWRATTGRHRLRVRATDGTGATQTSERHSPAPDGATGWHSRAVDVT